VTLDGRGLGELARRLTGVGGVVGVMLGGSRARGEHAPDSDTDLGVYYRGELDVAALGELAREVAGPRATVTAPGGWGPWVDGGGWLTIGGAAVDWIYRDLDRVLECWRGAVAGRFDFHAQVGHPLGFPDFAYPGEVALGVVLADPGGRLTELQSQARTYPPALGKALVARLWEAGFALRTARKAVNRGDTAYVAGCLFRAVGLCAHALCGYAGRWVVNEKGLVATAARLPGAPPGFAERAHGVVAHLGTSPAGLTAAIDRAGELVADTGRAVGAPPVPS